VLDGFAAGADTADLRAAGCLLATLGGPARPTASIDRR
jgi:hypothetical protein